VSETRWTPDEFSRRMALPEDHPERMEAERSPEFVAMRLMYEDFVTGTPGDPPASAMATAAAELERRLRPEIAASGTSARDARRVEPQRGSWREALAALFMRPAARAGLVFAVVAIVGVSGWWLASHAPREPVMRGPGESGFRLEAPRATSGAIALSWSAAPGADAYRVIVLGPDLEEVARIDAGASTRAELRRDMLPADLPPGAALSVEVAALRLGDVIATTSTRPIPLP